MTTPGMVPRPWQEGSNSWYDVAGPPTAPPILLLHGAAFTRHAWAPQQSDLATDFRVIAIDLPGHGVLNEQRFTIAHAVRLARRVIDTEANGRALVVGASLGGVVALELAHAHPARVSGLVLAGASVDYRRLRLRVLATINALLLGGVYPHRLLIAMQTRALPQLIPPELARPQIAAGFWFRGAAGGFWSVGGVEYLQHLAGFPGPTLFINGSRDGINCRGEAAFLQAAQHGSSCHIEGAGHLVNLEAASAFSAAVRAFAQQVAGAAATATSPFPSHPVAPPRRRSPASRVP